MPENAELLVKDIDELLGPSERRYFGGKFKLTKHRLMDIEIDCQRGTVNSIIDIVYPPDWSGKSEVRSRAPHLSTIDLIATCAQLCDAYLFCRFGLNRSQAGNVWMRSLSIKSGGQAHLDLTQVGAAITHQRTCRDADSLCGHLSEFSAEIGGFSVTVELDHPVNESGYRIDERIHLNSLDELLGFQRCSYYGKHYCHSSRRLHSIRLSSDVRRIKGKISVEPDPGFAPSAGLGCGYRPHYSALDLVLGGAQLCQALLYEMDQVTRDSTENLWMRSIEIRIPRPVYREGALDIDVFALRTRAIRRKGEIWRTADMRVTPSSDDAFTIRSSVAHKLPREVVS